MKVEFFRGNRNFMVLHKRGCENCSSKHRPDSNFDFEKLCFVEGNLVAVRSGLRRISSSFPRLGANNREQQSQFFSGHARRHFSMRWLTSGHDSLAAHAAMRSKTKDTCQEQCGRQTMTSNASAGNRTRVTSMATMYSTTRPLMPVSHHAV